MIQEIFIKTFQGLSNFSFKSKLSSWIGNIAYNHCLNFLQKKKHVLMDDNLGNNLECDINNQSVQPSDEPSGIDLLNRKITDKILQREIVNLPKLYQTILCLYHLEEESYESIAQIINLPMGTVKNYLFRAREQLKDNLLKQYKKEELWK